MRKPFLLLSLLTLSLIAFSQTIPDYIPTNNLVAWYPFSGNANDVSGNGNSTTNHGATLTTDRFGNPNAAYSFNGNDSQYFSCVNNTLPMGKTKRTISLWLNPYSIINTSQTATAFSYGNPSTGQGIMLGLIYSNIVAFQGWADDLTANYSYSYNQWINVLATFDSLNVKIYVNGSLIGSVQKPNWNTTGTNFLIGARYSPNSGFFDGKIDDIAVWSRVLTLAEIQKVYTSCNLTVISEPINQISSFGNSVKFILTASDTNCNYQWQSSNGFGFQNIINGGQYSGTDNDTLNVSNLTWINSKQKFRCIISSGTCRDTTNIVLLTLTNNFVIPNQIPTSGLVAWYPFNANAIDESGNGNEATSNNATLTSDRYGILNKSYLFNATNNEKITCLNKTLPMAKTGRTYSLWVNPYSLKDISQTSTAFSYGDPSVGKGIMLGLVNNGIIAFQGWGTDLNANYNYTFNQWINIIGTFDSLNVKLYINGNLIDSTTKTNWNTAGTEFVIGGRIGPPSITFDGKIDDIAVWNRVLTSSEIRKVAEFCLPLIITQPVNDSATVGNSSQFIITTSDSLSNFQWQTNLGLGFLNISNAGQFSGVNNDTLIISGLTLSNNNQLFRCIITKGLCNDTSNISKLFVTNNTGMAKNLYEKHFSIYPNPTNSLLYFILPSKNIIYNYSIIDQTGRIVTKGEIDSNNSSVSVEELAKGIYFLKLNADQSQMVKFIKY
ncbi:MAG: LamG-like jellyroll fold domain-containing protein [Bacteroidota bacterium]|nr:LamG-like jellyroll fold domain-containing protein [Bacteroidota bacterium]